LLSLPLCAEVDVEWGDGESEGEGMMVYKALGWLCEEPEHSFTLKSFSEEAGRASPISSCCPNSLN
jgi:hypothetical protein